MQEREAGSAVFVDPTGRRHRLVVRTSWALGAAGSIYLALVVVSLLLPPSLSRLSVPGLGPVLPGPGAAALGGAEGEAEAPEVLLERTPSPRPSPPRLLPQPPQPTPANVPSRSAAPTQIPAATPPPAQGSGAPTAAPTQRATAAPSVPPGQAERSPKPRPSKGPR